MNKAVDKVRRGEHKRVKAQKDAASTGIKYLWLKSGKKFEKDNKPDFKKFNID